MPSPIQLPEVRYQFYDVIARFVPGVVFVFVAAVVLLGPQRLGHVLADKETGSRLFSLVMLPFWLPITYFSGYVLAQVWDITASPVRFLVLHAYRVIRRSAVKKQAAGDPAVPNWSEAKDIIVSIDSYEKERGWHAGESDEYARWLREAKTCPDRFPRIHVMLERLRYIPNGDAERFLKLRAEGRMCEASVIGFSINLIGYLLLRLDASVESYIILSALTLVIIACFTRVFRLHVRFRRGVCMAWLSHLGKSPEGALVVTDEAKPGRPGQGEGGNVNR